MTSILPGILTGYVENVVEEFCEEIDPDEEIYKSYDDLARLRADLMQSIEGCVADWRVEQREKHGKD